ncbi:MAG: hypothetical protein ACTTI3_05700 [Treponema sp.]
MKLIDNVILLRFELEKLINVVSIVSVIFLLSVTYKEFAVWSQDGEMYFINDQGVIDVYSGTKKDLLALMKKQDEPHKGPVTVPKLKSAFAAYKKLSEEFGLDGELTWKAEYRFARAVFSGAFSPLNPQNPLLMSMINETDIENIYAKHIEHFTELMQLSENKIHASAPAINLAQKRTVPLYYDAPAYGWSLFGTLSFIRLLQYLIVFVIICSSFIFFNETVFSSAIHFSLATINGRKNHAIVKIQALVIFTTVLYLLVVGTYCALVFFTYGTDGDGSSLLTIYSLYNGTLSQFTRLTLIIPYFVAVLFSLFTFYISFYVKNIVSTIVVSSLAFYSGSMIPEGSVLERLIFLFPYRALHSGYLASRPIVYNLFGQPVLFVYLYIPAYLVFSVIIAFLIVRKFKTMKI